MYNVYTKLKRRQVMEEQDKVISEVAEELRSADETTLKQTIENEDISNHFDTLDDAIDYIDKNKKRENSDV